MFFKRNISTLSDEELLANYRKDGSNQYMGELYKRYSHLVFGVCLKYLKDKDEASDATLGLFEKLLTDMRTREVETFQYWLHTVAKNHCLMILRAKGTQLNRVNTYKKELTHVEVQEPGELTLGELREWGLNKLEDAITRLNGNQQECVRLFYLEEKSYKDISEKTGYSTNEVKSHIQNGRRNLKILLTGHA